jgi:hypothetical protein
MGNIQVTVEEKFMSDDIQRTRIHKNILPETALPHIQRIYAGRIKSIVKVDASGNPIDNTPKGKPVDIQNHNQKKVQNDFVLQELRKRAEELKIKGFKKMEEEELVKAIQDKHNKKVSIN